MQVMQDTRKDVGIFSANCDSHTLLSGVLTPHYWSQLAVPMFDQDQDQSSLNRLLFSWRLSDSSHAVDALMRSASFILSKHFTVSTYLKEQHRLCVRCSAQSVALLHWPPGHL